jgi:DNA-binding XRE family transcriptional regulator
VSCNDVSEHVWQDGRYQRVRPGFAIPAHDCDLICHVVAVERPGVAASPDEKPIADGSTIVPGPKLPNDLLQGCDVVIGLVSAGPAERAQLIDFGILPHDPQSSAYRHGMVRETPLRGIDLKAERVRAGLTQRDLGARLGVSGRRIANVEAEHRPAPSMVRRIIDAIEAAGVDT